MFQTGDYVVYSQVGICRVNGVTTMNLDGIPGDRLYYVLQKDGRADGVIYTPVESKKKVLRPMMTREEAIKLIDEIPKLDTLVIENDKVREEVYKACIRSCSSRELVRMIKTIYLRQKRRHQIGRKVTSLDERYMKLAEGNLYAELSKLLGIPQDEMVRFITLQIEEKEKSI